VIVRGVGKRKIGCDSFQLAGLKVRGGLCAKRPGPSRVSAVYR
jgi:hypothetical protein